MITATPPTSTQTNLRAWAPQEKSSRSQFRKRLSGGFEYLCLGVTLLAFAALVWLMWGILRDGAPHLNANFFTSFWSRFPEKAGIKAPLIGSLWVLGLTFAFAVPVGVGSAIYLEEYAERSAFARFVQMNIANLAGVPSVVYGILGLALFVRVLKFDHSILSAGLTLGLLVLPVIIIAAQEALRSVPSSLRDGSYALGATRWQTISKQVLPVAMPGILTGIILSLARAVGETAPLIMVGAVVSTFKTPSGLSDQFAALPIQIYHWTQDPKVEFKALAAAAIIVLLAVLLLMNGLAIWLRHRYNKRLG